MNHKTFFLRLPVVLLLVAACSTSMVYAKDTKEEQANLAQAHAFYDEVVNQGKFELINDFMSEDFVEHESLAGFEPTREGVAQFFQMFRQGFPDLKFTIDFSFVKDDRVVSYITITGTHKGEFMGMPATGKEINIKAIDIVRVKDGHAVEHWGLTDNMTMMGQLGMMGGGGH